MDVTLNATIIIFSFRYTVIVLLVKLTQQIETTGSSNAKSNIVHHFPILYIILCKVSLMTYLIVHILVFNLNSNLHT